ncbi:presenilin-associated rhomboid-like protein, mitochondrial isoform X5 [Manis javanica]|uniref:presenilin-associated rhomboid-like protein, mitochondrial isoform X5 n=1 Tax=Manis javanica TaxID=9974 RepID=UPI003C6CCB67
MAWRGWAQRGWGCGQAWAPPAGGRSCEELTAALASPRLLGRRFNFLIQQKCGFRKAPRKVEPRRSDAGTSREAYKRSALIPPVEETVFYPSPYPMRTLVKPFFFTVGFTGCAFGSAAIWQYESLKSRVQSYFDGIKADWLDSIRPQKEGDFRKEINKWWNNLSDGQRTVTGLFLTSNLLSQRCCPLLCSAVMPYFLGVRSLCHQLQEAAGGRGRIGRVVAAIFEPHRQNQGYHSCKCFCILFVESTFSTADNDQIFHIQSSLKGPLFANVAVNIQSFLLVSHGSKYVCFVELLLQHSEHSGSGAVHGSVLICRRYFQFCQLCV